MRFRSTSTFLGILLLSAAALPSPVRAQVYLIELFTGNCAHAAGMLASGDFYEIFGCAGPVIGIGDVLPAPIIAAGIGRITVCHPDSPHACDYASGTILPGGVIIDPTLMTAQLNFCVPELYGGTGQICASNVAMTGSGDLTPAPSFFLPLPSVFLSVTFSRAATVTCGTVSSERFGGGDQTIISSASGAVLMDEVYGVIIQ